MDSESKARFNGKEDQKSFVLWLTGLSGAGKSTLADKIFTYLKRKGLRVEQLDGDKVRSIFPDTGFTKDERDRHIKIIGYFASMLREKRHYCNLFLYISLLGSAFICTKFVQ